MVIFHVLSRRNVDISDDPRNIKPFIALVYLSLCFKSCYFDAISISVEQLTFALLDIWVEPPILWMSLAHKEEKGL